MILCPGNMHCQSDLCDDIEVRQFCDKTHHLYRIIMRSPIPSSARDMVLDPRRASGQEGKSVSEDRHSRNKSSRRDLEIKYQAPMRTWNFPHYLARVYIVYLDIAESAVTRY